MGRRRWTKGWFTSQAEGCTIKTRLISGIFPRIRRGLHLITFNIQDFQKYGNLNLKLVPSTLYKYKSEDMEVILLKKTKQDYMFIWYTSTVKGHIKSNCHLFHSNNNSSYGNSGIRF